MKLSDKRTAVCVTVVVCLLSFVLGGARALNGRRGDVLLLFSNGADNNGDSVDHFTDKKAAEAHEMAIIAEKYALSNANDLKDAADAALKAKTPTEIIAATKKIDEIEPLVYNNNSGGLSALSDLERGYWEQNHADIKSDKYILSALPYFPKAVEFNRSLNTFPAHIIRWAGLVKLLPIY